MDRRRVISNGAAVCGGIVAAWLIIVSVSATGSFASAWFRRGLAHDPLSVWLPLAMLAAASTVIAITVRWFRGRKVAYVAWPVSVILVALSALIIIFP